MPLKAQVHHVNTERADNRNNNLVICEDSAYHHLLHQRMRAVAAGCPADWLKCPFCKQFDAPENLDSKWHYHRECVNRKHREAYGRSKHVAGR